jgi:hypothetical protein
MNYTVAAQDFRMFQNWICQVHKTQGIMEIVAVDKFFFYIYEKK